MSTPQNESATAPVGPVGEDVLTRIPRDTFTIEDLRSALDCCRSTAAHYVEVLVEDGAVEKVVRPPAGGPGRSPNQFRATDKAQVMHAERVDARRLAVLMVWRNRFPMEFTDLDAARLLKCTGEQAAERLAEMQNAGMIARLDDKWRRTA